MLVELLRPIGELVAIPHPSKPHKSFLFVLVRCRPCVVLPHEVAFSFGMRKFIILITDNKLPFPSFRKDLEKYVYLATSPTRESLHVVVEQQRRMSASSFESKGKEVMVERSGPPTVSKLKERKSNDLRGISDGGGESLTALMDTQTRPVSAAPGVAILSQTHPVSMAPGVPTSSPEMEEVAMADACDRVPPWSDGRASRNQSSVDTLLSSGHMTVNTQAQLSETSALKDNDVATSLAEDVGMHGNMQNTLTMTSLPIGATAEVVGSQGPTLTLEPTENKMGLVGEIQNESGPSLANHDGPGLNVQVGPSLTKQDGPSFGPPNVSTGDQVGPILEPNDAKSDLGRPEISQQSHGGTPLAKDIFL